MDKTVVASSKLGRMLKDNDGSDKIQSIRLVGVCTDICVFFNAMLPEVEIIVDASCCAGIIPERHAKALFVMKLCGIKVENECKRLTECPWQNEVYL